MLKKVQKKYRLLKIYIHGIIFYLPCSLIVTESVRHQFAVRGLHD